MWRSKNCKTGFTLVELMIVLVIIGVLAGLVVPRLMGKSDEARRTAAMADIEANIAQSLDLYEVDTGTLPKSDEGLDALLKKPSDPKVAKKWKGPYLKKKPMDPWGSPYVYKYPGSHNNDYDLYSMGKDGVEGGGDDVTNWDSE